MFYVNRQLGISESPVTTRGRPCVRILIQSFTTLQKIGWWIESARGKSLPTAQSRSKIGTDRPRYSLTTWKDYLR